MEKNATRRTALLIFSLFLAVIGVTYLTTFIIRGYRPSASSSGLGFLPTGLLVTNSKPKGASVYIDGKLATATDDTLNLTPDEYTVEIQKDGYLPWEKTLTIKKEVVVQTDATLFRNAPDLKPLTSSGAYNPILSSDKTKIAYLVSDMGSEKKEGLWVLDLASGLPLTRSSTRQLTELLPSGLNQEKSQLIWSPDGRNILLAELIEAENEVDLLADNLDKEVQKVADAYLIPADRTTPLDEIANVTFRIPLLLQEWQEEKLNDLDLELKRLPQEFLDIATTSAKKVSFSPNNEKFFYQVNQEVTIPENLIPHPPARSTQPEERNLKPGIIYVYSLKEDINFAIGSASELGSIHWLTPDHLIYVDQEKNEVKVLEYDNNNRQTIYSGPFNNGFVFPSPSGESLITLTSLHSDSPGNLYEVRVR